MTPITRRALLSSAGAFSLIPRTAEAKDSAKKRFMKTVWANEFKNRDRYDPPPERKDRRYIGRWDRDRWDKDRWERNDGHGFEYCIPVPFHDFDYYYTLGRLTWTAAERRANDRTLRASQDSILVPEGFCTDLASVPQAFWSLLPKNGRHVYAAIIHDYLYWRQKTSRIEADEILKLTMIEEKVAWWKIDSIYLAVRSAEAQSAWDDNKRAKDAGQMRFLAKFPPRDQRVTWAEWKSDPANLRDDETADRVGRYAL
jgi:hypothetical protein